MVLLMLPLLIVAVPAVGRGLFAFMGAAGGLVDQAYIYSFWLVLSFPIMAYFMLGEAMLVSRGDTQTPMKTMIGGNIVNLVLDPVLMFGFDMGIAGAAIATLIGWSLAVLILIRHLRRQGLAMPTWQWKSHYRAEWAGMAHLSVYIFISQISSPLALALVNSILVDFGAAAVGAWTIMSRLELFSFMPLFGVGSALIAFISFNTAAGLYHRIRHGLLVAVGVSAAFVLPIMAFFILWPDIAAWPFQAGGDVRLLAAGAIQAAAWAHIVCPAELILFGLAQGLKKPAYYLPAVIVRLFVLRYPLAYALAGFYGLAGVFWSQPLANLGTAVVSAALIAVLLRPLPHADAV
jgi:putative MATE family efflux protein